MALTDDVPTDPESAGTDDDDAETLLLGSGLMSRSGSLDLDAWEQETVPAPNSDPVAVAPESGFPVSA